MKILVEGCSYDPEVLKGVLPKDRLLLTREKVKVENVGYFRSSTCNDFVFFLPKVLLEPIKINGKEEDRIFRIKKPDGELDDGFRPEEIVNPEQAKNASGKPLGTRQKEFLYEFSVWIYRAIANYEHTHPDTEAVWRQKEDQSGRFKRKYVTNTLLDVILALVRFNKENQEYFLFKIKEKHSGFNKINWGRTVSRSTALVQDDSPYYLRFLNKRRVVDFDEELLVIYYSILNYVSKTYGFRVKINMGYELISEQKFARYLNGLGVSRLRQIKYKYYSDRDVALWELCFAFFDRAHKANVVSDREEYLLAKNFEIVFESMVDDLIGDSRLDRFKELRDGKEIDHLYIDDSLTHSPDSGEKTFYIADSKYYKVGNPLSSESVVKQFTYAKDMLQLDLNLFLPDKDVVSESVRKRREPFEQSGLKRPLRDPDTEGYDVIPNFFISAMMTNEYDYDKPCLRLRNPDVDGEYRNIHFENRLFDRDTLILSHYDVNFLYVLKLYVQADSAAQSGWRRKVRDEFRRQIRTVLSNRFTFSAIVPHEGVDVRKFFKENFKYTIGKVYSPYPAMNNGRPVYSVALERPEKLLVDKGLTPEGLERRRELLTKENESAMRILRTSFYVLEDVELGVDPREKLKQEMETSPVFEPTIEESVLTSESEILEKKARWIFENKMFCLPSNEYTKQCAPDKIRVISLAWKPPVTMIVESSWTNLRPADIVQLTGHPFPLTAGIYHVWKGVLANCEDWRRRFKGGK